VTTPLAAVLLLLLILAWRQGGSPGARIAYGLYVLCAGAFIPYLVFWNLLGFHY
jgi:hypothetical protein